MNKHRITRFEPVRFTKNKVFLLNQFIPVSRSGVKGKNIPVLFICDAYADSLCLVNFPEFREKRENNA